MRVQHSTDVVKLLRLKLYVEVVEADAVDPVSSLDVGFKCNLVARAPQNGPLKDLHDEAVDFGIENDSEHYFTFLLSRSSEAARMQ